MFSCSPALKDGNKEGIWYEKDSNFESYLLDLTNIVK